jgi:hypothetical protein
MTFGDELYQDFEDLKERPGISMQDVSVDGDLTVSDGDVYITKYLTTLKHLTAVPVDRGTVLGDPLFVVPGMLLDGGERSGEPAVADSLGSSVIAVVGNADSGRRTLALRILDNALRDENQEIFEQKHDWDEPDADLIPSSPGTGYLLDLTGVRDPLGERFHDRLATYAMRARATNTHLVIVATEQVWNGAVVDVRTSPTRVMKMIRPSSLEVARRRIQADKPERTTWLTGNFGLFSGLLKGNEPPAEGVRLARAVLGAKEPQDKEALDRFLGWTNKLTEWFGASDLDASEHRAVQIAAAFLDGAPGRTVLDAADALLAAPEVNWPERQGGPLAGPGGPKRCSQAGLEWTPEGTVSITRQYPGIDQALLRHVWQERPQLVPILTRWLSEISQPKGPAVDCIPRLARSLTALAESQGTEVVLERTHEWLRNGSVRSSRLAVDVLDRLAVDRVLGPEVRKALTLWSKGYSFPERQRAVVEVCGKQLGREYTAVALTRLKYVLNTTRDESVRTAALSVLQVLLRDTDLSARVVKTLVDWTCEKSDTGRQQPSAGAFLDAFTPVGADSPWAHVRALLSTDETHTQAVRELLRDGWRAVWSRPELRKRAGEVLGGWCDAVEDGELAGDAVAEVAKVVFSAEANLMSGELDPLIGRTTPFRTTMRNLLVRAVREASDRQVVPGTHAAA